MIYHLPDSGSNDGVANACNSVVAHDGRAGREHGAVVAVHCSWRSKVQELELNEKHIWSVKFFISVKSK